MLPLGAIAVEGQLSSASGWCGNRNRHDVRERIVNGAERTRIVTARTAVIDTGLLWGVRMRSSWIQSAK